MDIEHKKQIIDCLINDRKKYIPSEDIDVISIRSI